MSQRFPSTITLLACLASLIGSGCESLSQLQMPKPTAQIAGVSIQDVAVNSAKLLFDIEVDNPYAVPLPLTNLDYSLVSAGTEFLSGAAPIQGSIPAKSKQVIALPTTINYLDVFKVLKDVRPGSVIPYKADVGLSVDPPALDPIRLPLKKEGEIQLPTVEDAKQRLLDYLLQ